MKKNIVFIILIVLLILTTAYNVVMRMNVEKTAKNVEVVLAYKDMEEMADQSEEDLLWWLKSFKAYGAESVALDEETIESLMLSGESLEGEVLYNLKRDVLWEERYPQSFVDYIYNTEYDPADYVVVTPDQSVYDFISKGLEKYPETFSTSFEADGLFAILLDGREEDVLYTQTYKSIQSTGKAYREHKDVYASKVYHYGLGFSDEKIKLIQESGLDVALRPINNMRYPDNLLQAYLDTKDQYGIDERYIIFGGMQILGYPSNTTALIEYMEANEIIPVLIETTVQRSNIEQYGLFSLTEALDYQAARILPFQSYMQERFQYYNYDGGQEIENVIFRAVTERNIHMIYFRPYKHDAETYVTDAKEYESSFERLAERFVDHKMQFGKVDVMPSKSENLLSGVLVGVGLLALVLIAARFFIKLPSLVEYILLLLGGLAVLGALYIAPNFGRQLLALGAALVVSCLGSVVLIEFAKEKIVDHKVHKTREILIKSILFTGLMGLVAMLGGLIVGGLLSHSKYLLELSFYRGVKVSEMLPLLVFIILYIFKFGFKRSRDEIKANEIFPKDVFKFVNLEIKLSYLLLAGIGAAVLYVYIARSGHETTVQPPEIEMIVRNFLELKLLARPRTKEFLIAIPSMMLFSYIAYKSYKPLVAILGLPSVIMFTSIINTFCHLRTPIYLSIFRTLIGLVIGLVIGTILIIIADLLERAYKRFAKRKFTYHRDKNKELGA